jgi:cold shock CspA family protein/uncharacterized LabA/DUF88 family protein
MIDSSSRLTRIGVFYDGNFFSHVSNYYCYQHERRARLSVTGLHEFIREEVAKAEGVDRRYCQVVDAHYFRGRLSASAARDREVLMGERKWDDVLMRTGIVTHYLPLSERDGRIVGEKGVDVWFALEAFELAMYKRFNVSVLIACDGDFIPLIRKLNTLGTRVMLLGWDFSYMDQDGRERRTVTSVRLLDEASYPILMDALIDEKTRRHDPVVNNLFLPRKEEPHDSSHRGSASTDTVGSSSAGSESESESAADTPGQHENRALQRGRIQNLREGYGFITPENGGKNIFFFWSELQNKDFNELSIGDGVEFELGSNDKGPVARRVVVTPAAS